MRQVLPAEGQRVHVGFDLHLTPLNTPPQYVNSAIIHLLVVCHCTSKGHDARGHDVTVKPRVAKYQNIDAVVPCLVFTYY